MIALNPLRSTTSRFAVALLLGAFGLACSSGDEAKEDPVASCNVTVEPFKEMIIVDETVLGDVRAKNAANGAWSFRHAFEQMAPEGFDAGELAKGWLRTWMEDGKFNGVTLDRPGESRSDSMQEIIICPWLKQTPANQCNDTCSACVHEKLDLEKAPFRLAAIVNRMDLRGQLKPTGKSGESRLVFTLTEGPADDPASKPLAMTIILEYALPDSRTASEWATLWHGLAKYPSYDEAFKAELETVTNAWVNRGVSPGRPNGSALSQLRTNESVLNWIWQLREFQIDSATGRIRLHTTANTPAEALNSSPILASWVAKNAEAVRSGQYEVPTSFLGGSADSFLYRWTLPGVDEATRSAFVAGTCNGCHSQDNANRDVAFHVNPFKQGIEKLSPFMWDPEKKLSPKDDDITVRTKLQRRLLCGDTTTAAPASPH